MKRITATMLVVLMIISGCGKQENSTALQERSNAQLNNSEQKNDNKETLEYETNTEVAEDDSDEDIVICESKSLIDNENFIAALHDRNGEYHIFVVGMAKNEEKATIMLAYCNEQLSKLYNTKFCKSYSVGVYCNDKIAMITVNDYGENASGFNSDGSAVSGDLPDWIVSDITMPENECNAYNDEILKALSDFCKEMQTSLK